jgi:hypothetical protein
MSWLNLATAKLSETLLATTGIKKHKNKRSNIDFIKTGAKINYFH